MLDFTVFGTVPKFCVSKVFSQIVSYFLIYFLIYFITYLVPLPLPSIFTTPFLAISFSNCVVLDLPNGA